jgi:hypothetical protein
VLARCPSFAGWANLSRSTHSTQLVNALSAHWTYGVVDGRSALIVVVLHEVSASKASAIAAGSALRKNREGCTEPEPSTD